VEFREGVSPSQWGGVWGGGSQKFFGFFASKWCILRAFWYMIRQFKKFQAKTNKSFQYQFEFELLEYHWLWVSSWIASMQCIVPLGCYLLCWLYVVCYTATVWSCCGTLSGVSSFSLQTVIRAMTSGQSVEFLSCSPCFSQYILYKQLIFHSSHTHTSISIGYHVHSMHASKGRFPLPEFTARELGPWTRVVETDLNSRCHLLYK